MHLQLSNIKGTHFNFGVIFLHRLIIAFVISIITVVIVAVLHSIHPVLFVDQAETTSS